MIPLSIFIATKNRCSDLEETLSEIYKRKKNDFEVIVLDNNSSDNTIKMIEKNFPYVKLIKSNNNMGGIKGRNVASSLAKGEILISLDDDSFPSENSLDRIIEEFEKDPKLGLIAMKIFDYKTNIENYKKNLLQIPKDSLGIQKYLWSGCGGAYRREIVEKLGNWEEWGIESPYELSMCAKSIKLGFFCKSFEDIYVLHKWSEIGDPAKIRIDKESFKSAVKSNLFYIIKYYPLNIKTFFLFLKIFFLLNVNLINTRNSDLLLSGLTSLVEIKKILKQRIPLSQKNINKVSISLNFLGK